MAEVSDTCGHGAHVQSTKILSAKVGRPLAAPAAPVLTAGVRTKWCRNTTGSGTINTSLVITCKVTERKYLYQYGFAIGIFTSRGILILRDRRSGEMDVHVRTIQGCFWRWWEEQAKAGQSLFMQWRGSVECIRIFEAKRGWVQIIHDVTDKFQSFSLKRRNIIYKRCMFNLRP